MKKCYLLIALATGMAFAGCSNNEGFDGPEKPTFADGTAYLKVNIADATRGTDGGFEYGTADEHSVSTADFYFYDAAGAYVTKANVWADGQANTNNPTENIEYIGGNVVVLKGVTEKTFPKYVVTVLNQPTDFKPGGNLKEMEAQLVSTINSTVGENVTNFVMTTTSYFEEGEDGNISGRTATENGQPTYFTTEVSANNFVNNPGELDNAKVLDIFVERLAAKIKVDVDNDVLSPVSDNENIYEMKVTVAGEDNKAEGGTNIGAETIRIQFDGWGLNATAKKSHIVKNIASDWTDTNLGFDWNVAVNNRSYWGTSTVYDEAYTPGETKLNIYTEQLNYNALNKMTVALGSNAYCAENTNTADKLKNNLSRVATSVIINATVLFPVYAEDGTTVTGWAAQDLVRVNGMLFKEADYIKYVLNNLKTLNQLNYFKKTVDGENIDYAQLSEDDVEIKNNGAGMVQLTLKDEDAEWYSKVDETYSEAPVSTAALETAFTDRQGNAYRSGKMFYTIPIQHLNNPDTRNASEPKEGEYGVVRNHYYKLTINSLNNLGKGVFDPENEEIIPEPNDENNYQLGVKINILSWKVVNQSVGL